MLSSAFLVVDTASEESEAASGSWKCTVKISEVTDGGSTITGYKITTQYWKNGTAVDEVKAVKGFTDANGEATSGSWGFDEDGYGPFGSYYAAFYPDTEGNNRMVCHLDPDDLTQAVGGGTTVEVDGQTVNISDCNKMWVLPKHYVSVDGDGTLTISSDSRDGTVADSFVIYDNNNGYARAEYNYLAIGVYEATQNGDYLGSMAGKSPLNNKKLDDLRTYADKNEVEDGIALLWNYHMFQTYRQCALAVMANVDAQAQIGYGNAGQVFASGSPSETGKMDGKGPYYGTSATDLDGAKCFIDNAWGSLSEWVDDATWSQTGLLAGQKMKPVTRSTEHMTSVDLWASPRSGSYGTSPSTGTPESWGIPTALNVYDSQKAPDSLGAAQGHQLAVGGHWARKLEAGLSSLAGGPGNAESYSGTRLVFLFNTDPVTTPMVRYDHSALTDLLQDEGAAASALTQKKAIAEGGTYDQLDPQDGYRHIGWEIDGEKYPAAAGFVSRESHRAESVWTKDPVVTFDLGGGTWSPEGAEAWGDGVFRDIATGGSYTVPTAEPVKEGNAFVRWDYTGGSADAGGAITLSGDVVLTAVWEYSGGDSGVETIVPYSVAFFDCRGHMIASLSRDCEVGETIAVPGYAGSTEQFAFEYWTGPDGDRYDAGDGYTLAADIGTAEFHAYGRYSVEYYDADGTTLLPDLTGYCHPDESFSLKAYPGSAKRFAGWMCDLGGTEDTYQPGYLVEERGDRIIRLYAAVGSAPEYTVTFDTDGGSEDLDPVTTNKPIHTAPGYAGTEDGYDFIGWEYDGRIYLEGETIVRPAGGSSVTLTAVWIESDDGPDTEGRYTIGYYDADGTLLAVERHANGEPATVMGYTGTATGFREWRCSGTSSVIPGEVLRMDGNIRLFAAVGSDDGTGPTPAPRPLPILPDDGTADGNHPVVIVPETEKQPWLGKNGKTVLIIAIIAAIIAELAVLAYSRRR